ncbi:hypothetical protein KR200_009307, partial [Drosophila serrata]
MFRLMSGIFANSLHGREFCFERLSACKCRSPRKSPPRDCVKKPFPVTELGESSPEKSRLLELMKQGCPCPKDTVKERWFFTNQHIIFALAKVLNRPANAVSDFLYLLTLQNFTKIMNPAVAPGNHCKVPLVYPNACEDYMRLFDTNGNIRSRFSSDSLMLLIRVMQTWLKGGDPKNVKPLGSCFEGAPCHFRSGIKARKAGIDRDSIAHRNGRRRRQVSDARACLNRANLIGYSLNGCPRNVNGSWNDSSASQGSPLASGEPGYVFGKHFLPKDLNDWDQKNPMNLEELDSYEDELAAERARRLKDLLFQLNERTYLTRNPYYLIEAIKNIQVEKTRRKSVKKSATKNSAAKTKSDEYYQMLRDSAIKSRLKETLFHEIGKDSSQNRHGKNNTHKRKGHEPPDEVVENGPSSKLYYGAPIPVLVHEPFNQDKPWTWLNRHPHQSRMNDKGRIVEDKNIRRYRRSTISKQMEKAREEASVHSIITLDRGNNGSATDVPMFGYRSDQK